MFIIIIELLKLLSKHQNIIILIYWHKKDIEKSPLSIMIACGTSNLSVWQELFLGVLQSYLSPTRLWEVTFKVFELANICYKRRKYLEELGGKQCRSVLQAVLRGAIVPLQNFGWMDQCFNAQAQYVVLLNTHLVNYQNNSL